jgi:hypothetical protein
VRGGDHHTQIARSERVSIATAGVGIGPSRKHIHADRGETGHQRVFDHVAGQSGILADDNAVAMPAILEQQPAAMPTLMAISAVMDWHWPPANTVRPENLRINPTLVACFESLSL